MTTFKKQYINEVSEFYTNEINKFYTKQNKVLTKHTPGQV